MAHRLALFGIAIVLTTLFERSADGQEAWPRITLTPGEVRDRSLAEGANIHITREKVVDIAFVATGLMRITALKKGVVFLIENDGDGKELTRTLIEVLGEDDKTAHGPRTVRGAIDNAASFLAQRGACAKDPQCTFLASLSPEGRKELSTLWLDRLGNRYIVNALADGLVTLETNCPGGDPSPVRSEVEAQSHGALARGEIVVRCGVGASPVDFILKGQLMLLNAREARELGLALSNEARPLGGGAQLPGFKAFLEKMRTKIVAEPALRLMAGVEGTVKSGSEFYLEAKSEKHEATWRRAGLELRATVRTVAEARVVLQFQAQLSHAGTSDGRVIESSVVGSEMTMTLGVPRLGGQVDTTMTVNEDRSIPYLVDMPIIGPWLRLLVDGGGRSRLYLWLEVEADTDGESGLGAALLPPVDTANDAPE